LTFEIERASRRRALGRSARAIPQDEGFAFKGPAVLVVAMGCAMSGLMAGLMLAALRQQLLAFLLGAALTGGIVWFGRDLAEKLRGPR